MSVFHILIIKMKNSINLQLWMFMFLAFIYSNSVQTVNLKSKVEKDGSDDQDLGEIKDYLDLYLQSLKDANKYKGIKLPNDELFVKKINLNEVDEALRKALVNVEANLKTWKKNMESAINDLSERQVGDSSKSNIGNLKLNSLKDEINQIHEMLSEKTNGLTKKVNNIIEFISLQNQDSSTQGITSILSSLKSFSNVSDITNSSLTQLIKGNSGFSEFTDNSDLSEIQSTLIDSMKNLQHTIDSGKNLSKIFVQSLSDLKSKTKAAELQLKTEKKELKLKKEGNLKKKDQLQKLKESRTKLLDLEDSYVKEIKSQLSRSESFNIKKELIGQSISERNDSFYKSQLELESTIKNLKSQASIVKSELNASLNSESRITDTKSKISKLLQYEDMILSSKVNR